MWRKGASIRSASALALLVALIVVARPSSAGPPGSPDRLNPPLADWADVKDFLVAPDGSRVVYLADQDTNGVTELYSVPIHGDDPVKLNGPLVAGGDVQFEGDTPRGQTRGFVISPDSSTVVYLADQDVDDVSELYSVPIDGGDPVKLNGALVAGGEVERRSFVVSQDSSTVLYVADQETVGELELYSAPIDGATPTKLSGDIRGCCDALVSPDSSTVVFRAGSGFGALYSVPIGGGAPVQLNQALASCCGIGRFEISPDAATVVYLADVAEEQLTELFSVPIGGGMPVRLNRPLPPTMPDEEEDDSVVERFAITPDSTRVVYIAPFTTERVFELHSVAIGGGMPVTISDTAGIDSERIRGFAITSDSTTVVYSGAQEGSGALAAGIFSTSILGGDTTQLSQQEARHGLLQLAPDSSRVVYRESGNGANGTDLMSAPLAGGPTVTLNGPLVDGGNVVDFLIAPDSSRVIYYADQDEDERWELHSVAPDGSDRVTLNGPVVDGSKGVRSGWEITSDSNKVVYRSDEIVDQQFELFGVSARDGIHCSGELATIVGTDGDDLLLGTASADVIHGLGGADTIDGLDGDDIICGGSGADTIRGGPGADTLRGQKGADTISGGKGADTIRGGTGADDIVGRSGSDDIRGQGGPDTIRGGTGADTIDGGARADVIWGNGGRDSISGGKGGDEISGGKRGDDIAGNSGADTLRGNSGPDTLDGGRGTDSCRGGSGNDTLTRCETT